MKKAVTAVMCGVLFILAVILGGNNRSERQTCSIFDVTLSYHKNTVRQFTRDDFYMGYTGGNSITVSTLPKGKLTYGGISVEPGFSFFGDKAENLSYTPTDDEKDFFTVKVGEKSAKITLTECDDSNTAPISGNMSVTALCGVPLRERIYSYDNDGDAVSVDIYKKPGCGTVVFTGTGYVYTAYPTAVGEDRFTFSVRDCFGNYSREYTCEIDIEPVSAGELYSDMDRFSGYTAAVMLERAGYISGETLGELKLFYPDRTVGTGELLVMLNKSAGSGEMKPCIDTGLITDSITEGYLKPYVKAALTGGIIDTYDPGDVLTKEEAYRIAAEYLGLKEDAPYKGEYLTLGDIDTEYLSYVGRLYNKGIISDADLCGGREEFTRNDMARLIYGIIKK